MGSEKEMESKTNKKWAKEEEVTSGNMKHSKKE